MAPTPGQIEAHQAAYDARQDAIVDYWRMIDELRRGHPVADVARAEVLSRFDATHKAWMQAGELLSRPRTDLPLADW